MFNFKAIDAWFERKYGYSPADLDQARNLGIWGDGEEEAWGKYLDLHQRIASCHQHLQPLVNLVMEFDADVIEVMEMATPLTAVTSAFRRIFTSLRAMQEAMKDVELLPLPIKPPGEPDDYSEWSPAGGG